MRKSVNISEKLYNKINDIANSSDKEQMMVFGGRTIGDTIVVSEYSFRLCDALYSDDDEVEIPLRVLKKFMYDINNDGYDTFFMVHSHKCNSNFFEFMYGDLSDEDEINSERLREVCNFFGLDYYDGITTGKRVYFWNTKEKDNGPILMNCYIDNVQVEYNKLTQITEDIEHKFNL